MSVIDQFRKEIFQLCLLHKVKRLYAFGSVVTERFTTESDIDLLVDFEQMEVNEYVDNYFDLKFSLEDVLKRKIDLLEERALSNPYFIQTLNQHKKLLYEH
jgi:predicted nucleotidyltransferase